MSVNELQALAKQFADAFDQRDLKTFLAMLSDDVEVFDHVPYRFDGKPLFAKYLNEVVEGLASIHGRTTLVFIKQSGQWKIVSAHFSAIPKAL
jgi:ketosteroid isomerase-like protein